jgi:Carboxypeptidase regulatory-like domain
MSAGPRLPTLPMPRPPDVRRTATALVLAVAAGWLAWTTDPAVGAQVRDGGRVGAGGSGSGLVSGIVLTASDPAIPLPYARVALGGESLPRPRVAVTGSDGRFRLDGLAPGHYSLSASKPGYVAMNAGATRPLRTGSGIDVAPGATTEVAFRLPKGAVIAGTITDPTGEPRQGVQVRVLRLEFDPQTGRRRAVQAGDGIGRTDDLGAYRVFGLPAGRYLVQSLPPPVDAPGAAAHYVTPDEVRAALAAVNRELLQTRPGMPPTPPPLPPPPPDRPAVGLAPMYFPGTPYLDSATPIELAAAEERVAVDFDLSYMIKSTVSGTVSLAPDGIPPTVILGPGDDGNQLVGVPSLAVTADGNGGFRFPAVSPGRYVLFAEAPNSRSADATWAPVPLTVSGSDVDGISVPVQAPVRISGRIVLDGWQGPLPVVSLPLPLRNDHGGPPREARIDVGADGRFSVSGLSAGPVRWNGVDGVRWPQRGWWLTSVTGPDGDLLDAPLVLSRDLQDVVVRLSRTASTITGRVRTADGQPASGLHVVLFPPEPSRWFFRAFRIAEGQTSSTGAFTMRNLPAGTYLAAVSDDLQYNEWYDPQVLRRLAVSATSVRVTDTLTTVDLVWRSAETGR